MMLTLDRFAIKPPEINVLNKNARFKITVVFRTKTSPRPIDGGGGQSGSLQNWLGGGGGGTTSLS